MKVLLGPLGDVREVPSFPEVESAVERESSSLVVLSGARRVQRAPRAHRSWSWSVPLGAAAEVAWFSELASGGVVGPVYVYSSKAAVENLVPPQLQSGGSGVQSGRRVLAAGDLEIGVSRVIPVKPNTSYTLSFLSNGSGSVTRRLLDSAGAQISSTALAGSTAGARATVTFTTTSATYGVTLTPTAGVGQVRLTEGAHTGFMIGDGAPPVVVKDPEATHRLLVDGLVLSDWKLVVEEIG